jgi:hypothetical protein
VGDEKDIRLVCEAVSDISELCCGVTLGGSRANSLNDEWSDVEMYFYYHESIPTQEQIDKCLHAINATHKRCASFLWNEYPWGPHSFFVVNGKYFEIGYRIVDEIERKLENYLSGNVAPTTDCHDLGLGYLYSGLAASICSEVILVDSEDEIQRLKGIAQGFPDELVTALYKEHMYTANYMLEGKMLNAVNRNDAFLYDVLASRVIRSLMIMAFACSRTHFPGDKWNEVLLMRTDWADKEVLIGLLRRHGALSSFNHAQLIDKRMCLVNAYQVLEENFKWLVDL